MKNTRGKPSGRGQTAPMSDQFEELANTRGCNLQYTFLVLVILPLQFGRKGAKQGRGHGGSMPPRGRWTGLRGGILWFCHSAPDLWKGMLWRNQLPLSRGTGAALQPWDP